MDILRKFSVYSYLTKFILKVFLFLLRTHLFICHQHFAQIVLFLDLLMHDVAFVNYKGLHRNQDQGDFTFHKA